MGQYGAGMMFQTLQPKLYSCMSRNEGIYGLSGTLFIACLFVYFGSMRFSWELS